MTNIYLNPLSILALTDTNADSIRKARRRKLMEFDLSDDGTIEIDKQKVSKNDFLTMAELLDTPENIEFFALLQNELHLLEAFLSSGEIDFFKLYTPRAEFKQPDFMAFVRPFYLPQFGKTLLQSYKEDNQDLLKQLFKPLAFIRAADTDAAYTPLYQHINQLIKSLEDFVPAIKKTNSQYNHLNLNQIFQAVAQLAKPDALNALPDFFQSQRNSIGASINQIAVVIFNKHEDFDTALQLLDLAKKLKIDSQQQAAIDKNLKAIERQQPAAQKKTQPQKTQASNKAISNSAEALALLIQIYAQLTQREISPAQAYQQLADKLNIAALNALPNDMPTKNDWRDELAQRLLQLANRSQSQYHDKENAIKILALAARLQLQTNMAKTIANAQLQAIRKKASLHIHQAAAAPPTWQPPQNNPYPQNNQLNNQSLITILMLIIIGIVALFLINK